MPCIALLGRKDEPTDAVEEYCRYLAGALLAHDIQLEICRVPWEVDGWRAALQSLRGQATKWRDTWVLVQYTALAWSLRGFPQRVLRVVEALRSAGTRLGIVFHDVEPYPGTRLIDSLRRFDQVWTMRRMLAQADLTVFTVPPDKLSWLTGAPSNAVFIPVGPNLPIPFVPPTCSLQDSVPTIGVFSITGGESGAREIQIILGASRYAAQKLGKVRLSVFGRQAEVRETELREGLRDLPMELSVEGVLEPKQLIKRLSSCDVLLFVRGHISSRRGSAIAGIACGLPIIAYPGSETAVPITDAGVVLISSDKPDDLNAALVQVLSDSTYRKDLAARSRAAYETHFAWAAISDRFNALLKDQKVSSNGR
jgi:glycosyltransferase involved in cell wall biosynthesis